MFLRINNSLIKCPLKLEKSSVSFYPKCLLPILFIGLCTPQLLYSWELLEKTVAIVNNEPVLKSDLVQLEQRLSKSGMVDDLLLFNTSIEALRKDPAAQLQFLINERILDSEVKRHNLAITMDRVDQEIREIAKRNNIGKEELIKTIQAQGINLSDYQAFMKQRIERQSVVEQEVTSKLRLSDEDVLAFYTNEMGKSVNKATEYVLAHIFFSPHKNSNANAALTRAQQALQELKAGKNFELLVTKYTDEESTSNNGYLGTFKTGEFSSEMELAVRNLNVGETSDIVKSRSGYHILKLLSKKMIPDPNFEKNKDRYRGLLFEKVFKRQFKNWLDSKRDEASITLN